MRRALLNGMAGLLATSFGLTGCASSPTPSGKAPPRVLPVRAVTSGSAAATAPVHARTGAHAHGARGRLLACGAWTRPGSTLYAAVTAELGDINDCLAVAGVWVITTSHEPGGVGSVLTHVCVGECRIDLPTRLADWKVTQLSTTPGTYSRFAGVNPDGSLIFTGGGGEERFDPRTGDFAPENDGPQ